MSPVGSTFDDALTVAALQSLFGNAGINRASHTLGGDDVVNGGTDDDELYGSSGDDRVEGSPGGDYLEGGSGEDIFEGDNVCEAGPCTGDADFIQARDGEADTVNCGVGADTAVVDSLDVVALDSQHGCEGIDRTAARWSRPRPAACSAPPHRIRRAQAVGGRRAQAQLAAARQAQGSR